MRAIAGLGLIFALVAGMLGLVQVEALQDSLVAATSGGIADLVGMVSTFWLLILGGVAVIIIGAFVVAVINQF